MRTTMVALGAIVVVAVAGGCVFCLSARPASGL